MKFLDSEFRVAESCSTGGVFNCVAVAITQDGVGIRNTKDSAKTTLGFSHDEWRTFVEAAKQGQFDI